jgi:hypothetical protein
MKTEKCFFGCPEVRYLGHRISGAGIVPDPDKVQVIASMPPSSNLKQAHTFLQTLLVSTVYPKLRKHIEAT